MGFTDFAQRAERMLDSSGRSFVPEVSVMRAHNYRLRKHVGEDATILDGLSAKLVDGTLLGH
jgi:hypothetical protein